MRSNTRCCNWPVSGQPNGWSDGLILPVSEVQKAVRTMHNLDPSTLHRLENKAVGNKAA